MNKLTAQTIFQDRITADLRQSMYELYATYYDGTSSEIFYEDLQHKNYVIVLWDDRQQLQGFSTLAVLEFQWKGEPGRALFSGDTIVARDYWGEQTLPLAWCYLAGQIEAQQPSVPLYWFLIVKGYRTYRYLPLFAKEFYPNYRYPTPPSIQGLIDYLSERKFGSYYHPETGLVQFPTSRGHLRGHWADIKEGYENKPDVRYFLERNPNYDRGDELVCFTQLGEENMRSHARRGFLKGMTQPLSRESQEV